jgi:ferric-dicitrate binding protein FerR (iron transport regulator)
MNGSPSDVPSVRIGTAEREAAASALSEHFAAGRLDQDELEERLDRAYAAKTGADLEPLFQDLPWPASPVTAPEPDRAPAPRRSTGRSALLIAILALAVLWLAVVKIPPFFLIPLVWIFLARSHRGRGGGPWGAPSHRW